MYKVLWVYFIYIIISLSLFYICVNLSLFYIRYDYPSFLLVGSLLACSFHPFSFKVWMFVCPSWVVYRIIFNLSIFIFFTSKFSSLTFTVVTVYIRECFCQALLKFQLGWDSVFSKLLSFNTLKRSPTVSIFGVAVENSEVSMTTAFFLFSFSPSIVF